MCSIVSAPLLSILYVKTLKLSNRMKSPQCYQYDTLKHLGISNHSPHDCRHTFSWLAQKYGVLEPDRKRMLDHAFKDDIANGVYGHRDLEDLRTEIEKIKICC